MKKIHTLIILICMLFLANEMLSAQHMVIASNNSGGLIELKKILTEAYNRIGITIEFKNLPVERAIQMANDGIVDGDILRVEGIESDYPNLVRVPFAIRTDDTVAVTRNREIQITNWSSLQPYRVGYIRGIKDIEDQIIAGTKTEVVSSQTQLYQKLESGRTDIVIDARSQAEYSIKEYNLDNLIILEPPLISFSLYHYVHKKNKDIIPSLTAALRQMNDEGFFSK